MFIEILIAFGIGYPLYKYEVPESWCRKARFVQLYVTGWAFFTLLIISGIYEAHCILYTTLKLNRGNFDEDQDDWWKINNLFYPDAK